MKHRWRFRVLVVAALAGFVVWLEPTRVVWGWLRGEAFYQARPTSWWARELEQWDYGVQFAMMSVGGEKICRQSFRYHRENTRFDEYWIRWFGDIDRPTPGLLTGDPAAEAVLLALWEHPSEQVRKMAEHGVESLRRLQAFENRPAE